jgi:hypothetical protein
MIEIFDRNLGKPRARFEYSSSLGPIQSRINKIYLFLCVLMVLSIDTLQGELQQVRVGMATPYMQTCECGRNNL